MHLKQVSYQKFLESAPNCPFDLYKAILNGKVLIQILYKNQQLYVYYLVDHLSAVKTHHQKMELYSKGNKGLYDIKVFTKQDLIYY